MTTPQSELKRIADNMKHLSDLLDPDDDCDIVTRVRRVQIDMEQIKRHMDMLQDQMSLIIKLLSKQNGA